MKRITIYMAVLAMLLFSCNTGADREKGKQASPGNTATNKPSPKLNDERTVADNDGIAAPQSITKNITHADWDKKIIRTADVTLELKDYAAYNQSIHNGLRAYGAYIAEEEQSLDQNKSTNELTIKVPVEQFESLINSFSGDGIKVLQKKIRSEDVTGEVVDTKSRMEAKKQVRDRYLEFLKQAKNMKEILQVQQEINTVQEEIESASGRVDYLSHQSVFSTIHLRYFQYSGLPGTENIQPGYLVKLKESFNVGIRLVGGLLIFIVSLWPLILGSIIAVIIWKKKKITTIKQ